MTLYIPIETPSIDVFPTQYFTVILRMTLIMVLEPDTDSGISSTICRSVCG